LAADWSVSGLLCGDYRDNTHNKPLSCKRLGINQLRGLWLAKTLIASMLRLKDSEHKGYGRKKRLGRGWCRQKIDPLRTAGKVLILGCLFGWERAVQAAVSAPLDGIDPYFNCIKRSITTMPTIFWVEVIDGV
jgi:hypothetical protein